MVKTSFRVTLKPLSELADNLSEIYKKNNVKDAWKDKNIKSVCDFIGLKNKLYYKCKKCKKDN